MALEVKNLMTYINVSRYYTNTVIMYSVVFTKMMAINICADKQQYVNNNAYMDLKNKNKNIFQNIKF